MFTYLIQFGYFWILKTFKPILKFIGSIYLKSTSKEHIFRHYYLIESKLKPGDVILTKSDGHLSNLTNLGFWKHAVVFVGGDLPYVVEAIGDGVVKRTLVEMLSSKDRICILRPTERLISGASQLESYLNFILLQVGKKYDYAFDSFTQSSEESFYCSELVYSGIKAGNPEAPFDLRSTFGIKTVSPMDLYNMVSRAKFENLLEIQR